MRDLSNLIVDLDERFTEGVLGATPAMPGATDERVLAWIDETFGGWWSSEAHAATTLVLERGGEPAGFVAYDGALRDFVWLRPYASERDLGIFGPLGVAPHARGSGLGGELTKAALAGLRARGFARALIPAVGDDALIRFYAQTAGARVANRWRSSSLRPARAVVLASGSGSNLQALVERVRSGTLPLEVSAVVVNDPGAYAIQRARSLGVPVRTIPWARAEQTRVAYDARLLDAVRAEGPDVVLLLGWMHLLAQPFLDAFERIVNVHPAFLPLDPRSDTVVVPDGTRIRVFRGAHAVRDAIAAGSPWTGASVHEVTSETDRGRVLTRRPVRLSADAAAEEVAAQLHPIEHELVAAAVRRCLYERG